MLAGWRDLLNGDLQRYGKCLFCRLRTILQMVGCCNLKLDQKVFAIQLARLAQPKTLWIFYRTLMKSFVSGHTLPPVTSNVILKNK